MKQSIKIFRAKGLSELAEKIDKYATEHNKKIVTISHERGSSIMGDEVKGLVVFEG